MSDRAPRPKHDQTGLIGDRQRTQQERVGHREDRDRKADAERQNGQGD